MIYRVRKFGQLSETFVKTHFHFLNRFRVSFFEIGRTQIHALMFLSPSYTFYRAQMRNFYIQNRNV